jgi:hypothetical protein
MITYKLYKFNGEVVGACYKTSLGTCFFGFRDPANTDYANFKKEILADEAQLQDADKNVMADAKAYVATLP